MKHKDKYKEETKKHQEFILPKKKTQLTLVYILPVIFNVYINFFFKYTAPPHLAVFHFSCY